MMPNGSQESPGKAPLMFVASDVDLTTPPYSSFLDGECVRIINHAASSINVSGAVLAVTIDAYKFKDFIKWNNGIWDPQE